MFAVPGHDKDAIKALSAFLSGVAENLPNAEVTVDWFHIVQTFTNLPGGEASIPLLSFQREPNPVNRMRTVFRQTSTSSHREKCLM
ncbi:hypothetical protein HOP52_09760 [Halomonas campisalis]|uniref:Transposase IS204/IS1001/IS1096/IS1165 DDE domain-containing protein n=1 Tax=Billgrantia campisalis TaxID=74661 RepID=A0ABS9P8C9_9GAMM|nr:hypothetical protein [Halomonas campisalis]